MAYNNANAQRRERRGLSSSLADVGRQHGLSPAGAQFVAMATDPFSDERQPIIGFPDQTGGKSVLYDIRKELPLNQPTYMAGDIWDCHVSIMPCMFNMPNQTVNGAQALMSNHEAGHVEITGTACGDPAGGAFWNANGDVIVVNIVRSGEETFQEWGVYDGIPIPELMQNDDRARLISIGYELINETEDQYKSGAHTDYRCDANPNESHAFWLNDPIWTGAGGLPANTYANRYPIKQCFLPPTNLAAAKQIGGVTRASHEGSLVVGCFDDVSTVAEPASNCSVVLHRTGPATGGSAALGYGDVVFGTNPWDQELTTPPALGVNPPVHVREIPFLMSGTYATNLSPQTKLRLVLHAVVEVFPGPGDDRMALAKLAPPYDPVALEYLSSLQTFTLPGYPVSWNSFGKYTKKLKWLFRQAQKVAGFAAPGVMALPDARARAIGLGLLGASQLGKRTTVTAGKRRVVARK